MESVKKYTLTNETFKFEGHLLHRIQAVANFGDVKAGDLGGWIESQVNLSQYGDCWVYNEAKVYGHAVVSGNARVSGDAQVYENARVHGEAYVCDCSEVFGNACVAEYARVYNNAKVFGYALIYDNAQVHGDACVSGGSRIFGEASVYDNAQIYGSANVCDEVDVYGNAKVHNDVLVWGRADICGDAEVQAIEDYIVFKNSFSSGRWFTWTRSNDMWKVGCFYGTGKELIKKAYEDSEEKGDYYKLFVELVEKDKEVRRKYDRIDTLAF